MGLYPEWSPWLDKPAAARVAALAIVESAVAVRGAAGYLDFAGRASRDNWPFWLSPRARSPRELVEERLQAAGFDAEARSFDRALEHLAGSARSLGAGSFIFLVSDFLDPPPPSFWLVGATRRWDLVPVVVQDPVWEQSFPAIGSLVVPVADPDDGNLLEVRLRASEARSERCSRKRARAELLLSLAAVGLDPVLIEQSDPESVRRAFLDWAERRSRARWKRR
jgi:hypothetical protein